MILKELQALSDIVITLPDNVCNRLQPLVQTCLQAEKHRQQHVSILQEALGQLRLDLKYLVFDLEATRRERDDYKARLHSTGK